MQTSDNVSLNPFAAAYILPFYDLCSQHVWLLGSLRQ